MDYITQELLKLLETKQCISKEQSILTGFVKFLPHIPHRNAINTPLRILNEKQLT